MNLQRMTLLVCGLIALLGCATGQQVTAETSETGNPVPDAVTETTAQTNDIYPTSLTSNEAWSLYWAEDPVSGILEVEQYDSVEEQAASSSSVVRGRITDVVAGRVFGPYPSAVYATMFVVVDELPRGEQPQLVNDRLRVEFAVPGVGSLEEAAPLIERLRGLAAGEPSLFFLRSKSEEAVTVSLPPDQVEAEQGWYRIVASTGLMTSDNGSADVTFYRSSDTEDSQTDHAHPDRPIVAQAEGMTMAEVEDLIRAP